MCRARRRAPDQNAPDRIGRPSDNVFIVCETSLQNIEEHIEKIQPGLLIVDSIQTIASDELESVAGSVSQVRECASRLLKYAKESSVPVMLIGHITKDGNLAGPKVLEHIVDAVLHFEGDGQHIYRLLRAIKNRFGSTSELGIYEMCQRGLREVRNPSEMLLSTHRRRPLGRSHRSDHGGHTLVSHRSPGSRLNSSLRHSAAVGQRFRLQTYEHAPGRAREARRIQTRGQRRVSQHRGRTQSQRPSHRPCRNQRDTPSNIDMPIPHSTCITGEVGLSGEIRPVGRIEQRIREAEKLGMDTILIPRGNLKGIDTSSFGIRIIEIAKVEEALRTLFCLTPGQREDTKGQRFRRNKSFLP